MPLNEQYFFFEGKGLDYFLRHTLSRKKLLQVVTDYPSVLGELQERYESLPGVYPEYSSSDQIYTAIREMRMDQVCRRARRERVLQQFSSQDRDYLSFVGHSLDYNEDNRLLRSISFYHIMKDPTVPDHFGEWITLRQ
jgi:hypothetical protein